MNRLYILLACLFYLCGCSEGIPESQPKDTLPEIFPDYCNVTVPCNIAPLNFKLNTPSESILVISNGEQQVRVDSEQGAFQIPSGKWHRLLETSAGETLQFLVYAEEGGQWMQYKPFSVHIAKEPIDSYLVYRRIAPGYRMWGEMGIYQRNLENFKEEALLSNNLTNNNCMNCHSFCMQNPGRMLFHQRMIHNGTYMIIDGEIEKLNTKTEQTISALVYPSWHPSGKYVAFSTNDTKQDFHLSDPNKIEVFDNKSDVVVYDVEKHEIITSPKLFSEENFETFPTFSPDGKRLYFCSAKAKQMPESYKDIRYNLLSISFDPETRVFGRQVDTLYNAEKEGHSVKFPRVSPDGRYLLYTISSYGNFSIWHKDADLRMLELNTLQTDSLPGVNSKDVDSYHSWSSNSRWFVFSSRRGDGLYTRPYICYINKEGVAGKPFLLPQQDADYYDLSLFSFNIPELVKGKVKIDTYKLTQISKYGPGTDISFMK